MELGIAGGCHGGPEGEYLGLSMARGHCGDPGAGHGHGSPGGVYMGLGVTRGGCGGPGAGHGWGMLR